MEPRSPGPGEFVAGAGGALLLLATFLPWFGVDSAVQLPGRSEATTVRGVGVNAWHAFAAIDVVLLIVALLALALLVLPLLGVRAGRTPLALAVVVAGLVCAVLVVYRLIDPPDLTTAADTASTETGRRLGPFFALLAALAITWGGWRSIEDEAAAPVPAAPEPAAAPHVEAELPMPELPVEAEPVDAELPVEPELPVEAEPAEPEPVEPPRPEPRRGAPIRSAGVAAFDDLIARLEPLLEELWEAPAAPRAEHGQIPAAPGVYVFTRRDEPVHIGQAPDLRRRLAEHCRPSSGHTKATLAFEIAKRAATREGIEVDGPPARLATSDDFTPYFVRAKEAVAELPVRFVEVDSRELRTVFEVYGALALGTVDPNADEPG